MHSLLCSILCPMPIFADQLGGQARRASAASVLVEVMAVAATVGMTVAKRAVMAKRFGFSIPSNCSKNRISVSVYNIHLPSFFLA